MSNQMQRLLSRVDGVTRPIAAVSILTSCGSPYAVTAPTDDRPSRRVPRAIEAFRELGDRHERPRAAGLR